MKFLIFGGSGFIGKELYSFIKDRGDEVVSASRSGKDSISIDITNKSCFSKIDFLPDVIVNCASKVPLSGSTSKDPGFLNELFLTNVVGAANICNWAVHKNVPKIINCSTLVVIKRPWPKPLTEDYSNIPEGPHVGYCMSKLSQEQIMNEIVKVSGTKVLHLRLSSVYGKGMIEDGIIFNLLKDLKGNKQVKITNGENTFDFINVVDVCKSIHALARINFENGIVNLANGKPVSLFRLVEILKEATSSTSPIINYNLVSNRFDANISTKKLKEFIGEIYDGFLPFEKGIKSLLMKD